MVPNGKLESDKRHPLYEKCILIQGWVMVFGVNNEKIVYHPLHYLLHSPSKKTQRLVLWNP